MEDPASCQSKSLCDHLCKQTHRPAEGSMLLSELQACLLEIAAAGFKGQLGLFYTREVSVEVSEEGSPPGVTNR